MFENREPEAPSPLFDVYKIRIPKVSLIKKSTILQPNGNWENKKEGINHFLDMLLWSLDAIQNQSIVDDILRFHFLASPYVTRQFTISSANSADLSLAPITTIPSNIRSLLFICVCCVFYSKLAEEDPLYKRRSPWETEGEDERHQLPALQSKWKQGLYTYFISPLWMYCIFCFFFLYLRLHHITH